MKPYAQGDKRWKYLKLGTTKISMKSAGCFVTALASLAEQTPDVVLGILNRANAFTQDGKLLSNVASEALKLRFKGRFDTPQPDMTLPTIAETNFYRKQGIPQHFFVYLGKGQIMDPIDGKVKANPYPIVSYRLFSKPEEPKSEVIPVAKKEIGTWARLVEFFKNVVYRIFKPKT